MSRGSTARGVLGLWCCAAAARRLLRSFRGSRPSPRTDASNILSPAGYCQTKIDDTHYKVTATGTEATPKERVEKIARARAAQIGVDQKLQVLQGGQRAARAVSA